MQRNIQIKIGFIPEGSLLKSEIESESVNMNKSKTKKWYQSKIVWINVISIIVESLQFVIDERIIPAGLMLIIVNTINIILRKLTDTKLN